MGDGADAETVHLHRIGDLDHEVGSAVDDLGLHEVGAFRIHLDYDIGSLDLKFSGAADVGSQEGRLFSDGVVVALVEIFQILFRRATLLEELFHLVFVQSQGLGLIGMLVHHLCDLFMDGLYGLVVAVRTEGLLDDGIEGLFLAFGREGRHAAQDLVDEGFVEPSAFLE